VSDEKKPARNSRTDPVFARLRGLASAAALTPEERIERARRAGLASAAARRRAREEAGLPEPARRRADHPQPSLEDLEPYLEEFDRLHPEGGFSYEERRRQAILLLKIDLAKRELDR